MQRRSFRGSPGFVRKSRLALRRAGLEILHRTELNIIKSRESRGVEEYTRMEEGQRTVYSIYGRKGLAWAIDQVKGYYIVSHNTTRESHVPNPIYRLHSQQMRTKQSQGHREEGRHQVLSQVPRPKSKKQHRREESYVPDTHHASRLLKDHPPPLPPDRFQDRYPVLSRI